MKRRAFISLLGGAAAWPIAAHAQRASRVARIGFLGSTFASPWASRVEAFRSGLRNLGYVEGENIAIEFRWAEEKYDQLPRLAAELIRSSKIPTWDWGTTNICSPVPEVQFSAAGGRLLQCNNFVRRARGAR